MHDAPGHTPGGTAPQPLLDGARELLAVLSVEVTPRHADEAAAAAELLPAGTRVYVTALPGQTLGATLDTVVALRRAGFEPLPHVAARRVESRVALRDFLARATGEAGVERALVVAGDVPQPVGPYADSVALLREGVLANAGLREIGVAGYPEGHPKIERPALDAALEEKRRLAAEQALGLYVVTQFCFAPTRITEFCAEHARQWPQVPVYVGVPGPTAPAALLRYAQRCGVSASLRALGHLGVGAAKLVMHTDPGEQVAAIAGYCAGRDSCNVVGLHLYSFGDFLRAARWVNRAVAATTAG